MLHVTYSVVNVIQKLHCVARDPLTLELYSVWYAYICVNMTNTNLDGFYQLRTYIVFKHKYISNNVKTYTTEYPTKWHVYWVFFF